MKQWRRLLNFRLHLRLVLGSVVKINFLLLIEKAKKDQTASSPFSIQTRDLAWGRTVSTLQGEAEAKREALSSLPASDWGLETGMKIDPWPKLVGNLTPEQFSTAASEVIFMVFLPHTTVHRVRDDRKNGYNYTSPFIISSYHEAWSDRSGHVKIRLCSHVEFEDQI